LRCVSSAAALVVLVAEQRGARRALAPETGPANLTLGAGSGVVARRGTIGSAATHYPEANVLVPVGSVAEKSNTPASKSVWINSQDLHSPGKP
jgi:hypothetical protein